MRKRKQKKYWCLREFFFCFFSQEKKQENFMDIIQTAEEAKNAKRRGSTDTTLSDAITLGKSPKYDQ